MHLAVVCPDIPGHLNPTCALGRELTRRGHRVTLVCSPNGRPWADRDGFGFVPVGEPEVASGAVAERFADLGRRTGLRALRATGKLLAWQADLTLRDGFAALADAGVDGFLADQVSPAGAALADALGRPYVVTCAALAMHQEPGVPPPVTGWKCRRGPLGRARNRAGNLLLRAAAAPVYRAVDRFRSAHRLGRSPRGNETRHGLAQVAQQPAFFDFPRAGLPDQFHYTGPWLDPDRDAGVPFPWDALDGRPVVYASLGTLQNRLHGAFRAILEACAPLDVQVVLSLGRPGATWGGPVPANAVVVPFAPQLAVLDRASLAITHAGLNTALECLSAGVPMVCLPVTNDQPGVARRVEWVGAGVSLPIARVTAARLRPLVERALACPTIRAAADDWRYQIATTPGAAGAADVIERAIGGGATVTYFAAAGSGT